MAVRKSNEQKTRESFNSMRKIFGSAMAFSVVGATVLGGTLAWNSDQVTPVNSVLVGALDWTLSYEQVTDALIGPNGHSVVLGHVTIGNDGDFNLSVPSTNLGEVIIEEVLTVNPGNHASCDALNFVGAVTNTDWDDEIAPGETSVHAARVDMLVDEDAPEACIGAEVRYHVRVAVETADNGPVTP